jgi:hypothetical protein
MRIVFGLVVLCLGLALAASAGTPLVPVVSDLLRDKHDAGLHVATLDIGGLQVALSGWGLAAFLGALLVCGFAIAGLGAWVMARNLRSRSR